MAYMCATGCHPYNYDLDADAHGEDDPDAAMHAESVDSIEQFSMDSVELEISAKLVCKGDVQGHSTAGMAMDDNGLDEESERTITVLYDRIQGHKVSSMPSGLTIDQS
jgi:hypothetical protein